MHWMVALARRLPGLRGARREGARFTDVDGHEYVDLCLGDTGAMTGHAPRADAARDRRAGAARDHARCCPTEDALWVGEEMAAALRAAVVAVRADRHRRQPLRDPDRPRDHRPAEDPRVQLVLPRHRRRDVRDARRRRRRRRARGQHRPAGRRSPRPRASSSSTTSRRSSASSPTATSRACSPSRRSPTSASCCRSPATTTRCARPRARPGRC